MHSNKDNLKLAQSTSALGAGLLGFGIGAKLGFIISNYAIIIIVAGAIFHIWGMYVLQIKNESKNSTITSKVLWLSAWVCLIALLIIIVYLSLTNIK